LCKLQEVQANVVFQVYLTSATGRRFSSIFSDGVWLAINDIIWRNKFHIEVVAFHDLNFIDRVKLIQQNSAKVSKSKKKLEAVSRAVS
jgi:hypothetical protein